MDPGSTTPALGRTQYFFGEVVLTLKATLSLPGLCRDSVTGMFLRSSKRNLSSLGLSCRCSPMPACSHSPPSCLPSDHTAMQLSLKASCTGEAPPHSRGGEATPWARPVSCLSAFIRLLRAYSTCCALQHSLQTPLLGLVRPLLQPLQPVLQGQVGALLLHVPVLQPEHGQQGRQLCALHRARERDAHGHPQPLALELVLLAQRADPLLEAVGALVQPLLQLPRVVRLRQGSVSSCVGRGNDLLDPHKMQRREERAQLEQGCLCCGQPHTRI